MKNLVFDNFGVFNWIWIPFAVFGVIFVIVFVLILVKVMIPAFKRTGKHLDTMVESASEMAAESYKTDVECSFCETIYNKNLNKCPNCGAPRQNDD